MKFHEKKGRMSDREAAVQLIMQADCYGIYGSFKGVAPFRFICRLGLLSIVQSEHDNPDSLVCLSHLRIFNYDSSAIVEYGCSVLPDGHIQDQDNIVREPAELISHKAAPSGWEIHNLKPGYGNIVKEWFATR